MKFIYAKQETKTLTFDDCQVNQFFVYYDNLFQKVTSYYAHQITRDGKPFADQVGFEAYVKIERLLPIVERIEF